jgi:tetratricopeptide (TPR) repeat protein
VPTLAFDIELLADNEDLWIVVHGARGMDLPCSAMGAALACGQALFGTFATRSGSIFTIVRGASSLARAVFPRAGARAPAVRDVRWTSIGASGDVWALAAAAGGVPHAPSADGLRARELALLLQDADDALLSGDDTAARDLCLAALERAPRHPAIVSRLVDIDVRAGGRAEAALSLMNETREAASGDLPGGDLVYGMLLAETGDVTSAVARLHRYAVTERCPALSARAASLAASLCADPSEAGRHLDEALTREPRSLDARWLRVAKRLELGRVDDALADVEHLDALVAGKGAKHATWMRAGALWRSAGLGRNAGELFERSLRYVPDDPVALAGLGAALVDASRAGDGRDRRGVALLSRALTLSERARAPDETLRLELARCLAERLGDLPTAIAHVSRIPPTVPEGGLARGFEGRWRVRLGDPVGASLAFERLREHAESLAPPLEGYPHGRALVELLVEGAELFERRIKDLRGAQRFLEVALKLSPSDPDVLARYRHLGEVRLQPALASRSTGWKAPSEIDVAEASARVEQLTERLRADPSKDEVADELALLLERLGRGHELLALLWARLDNASGERVARLVPRVRETLERLASGAEVEGRRDEAQLFRSALLGLS